MQIFRSGINYDFIGKRKIAYTLSAAVIAVGMLTMIFRGGPRFGIDFEGGTLIQVKFPSQVEISAVKAGLSTLDLEDPSVQHFGERDQNEYLIRTERIAVTDEKLSTDLVKALKASTGQDPDIRRVEMVGPQVGQDLREKALFAIFYSLLFISIYISGRFELKWLMSGVLAGALIAVVYFLSLFNVSIPVLILAAMILTLFFFWVLKFKYAMGAIVSLIHDVLVTVAFFALLDKEFTLPVIAAILTIIGYSLNDTIVIFDRVRENLRKYQKIPFEALVNRSVNETLSRTILTAGTVFIVVLSLFILGGGIIHDFAFAMLVGTISGTYSTIYVASPILIMWHGESKKR